MAGEAEVARKGDDGASGIDAKSPRALLEAAPHRGGGQRPATDDSWRDRNGVVPSEEPVGPGAGPDVEPTP